MKKRELLEKIEQLEKRIEELEARPLVVRPQPFAPQPFVPSVFEPWPNHPQPYVSDPMPGPFPWTNITWCGTGRRIM